MKVLVSLFSLPLSLSLAALVLYLPTYSSSYVRTGRTFFLFSSSVFFIEFNKNENRGGRKENNNNKKYIKHIQRQTNQMDKTGEAGAGN